MRQKTPLNGTILHSNNLCERTLAKKGILCQVQGKDNFYVYQDYKVNKIGPNIQVQISQKTLQKENVIYHIYPCFVIID